MLLKIEHMPLLFLLRDYEGNAIDTHQSVYSKGTIKCKQSCPCTPCGCPLPTTNSILCGKDGKEYPTECFANCRYVYIVY